MKHARSSVSPRHMAAVLDALEASDGLTRAALCEASGCSLMTVCRAEDTLLRLNVIRRVRERAGADGRPAAVLHPAFPVPVLLIYLSDGTASARLYHGTMPASDKGCPAAVTAGGPLLDVNENARLLMRAVADSALPELAGAAGSTRVLPAVLLPVPVSAQAHAILSHTVRQGLSDCGLTEWAPPGTVPETSLTVIDCGEAALYALEHGGPLRGVTSLALMSRGGSRLLLRRTPADPWFTPPGSLPLYRALNQALSGVSGPDVPELRRLLSLFPPGAVLAESCPPFTDAVHAALRQALPAEVPLYAADLPQAVRGALLSARRQTWDSFAFSHSPAHP